MTERRPVRFELNGAPFSDYVAPNQSLVEVLRTQAGATDVKYGCGEGVCGTCTVLIDGDPVSACLIFAVQADGHAVQTVEGLAPTGGGRDAALSPLQQAFRDAHGLQCGYCTPGMLMTMSAFLEEHLDPTEEEVRHALSGNLCRCTGYQHIVDAVLLAARRLREATPA